MTSEEMNAKIAFLADNLNIKDEGDRDYFSRMIRVLVSRAYEEAERVAECRYPGPGRCGACEECLVAAKIRALKDSLVQEPVPSAS